MKWIRNHNLYDIIKKYPPRHTYLDYSYWYEKVDDKTFAEVAKQLHEKYFNTTELIKDSNINSSINISKEKTNVVAFNYIWPSYGYDFLKISIESILPYVDKYV